MKYQLKSIIYINMTVSDVEISRGLVRKCNSLSGAIYIDKAPSIDAMLTIVRTTFLSNSAFEGANAVKINMPYIFETKSDIPDEFLMKCGKVLIEGITFSNNAG